MAQARVVGGSRYLQNSIEALEKELIAWGEREDDLLATVRLVQQPPRRRAQRQAAGRVFVDHLPHLARIQQLAISSELAPAPATVAIALGQALIPDVRRPKPLGGQGRGEQGRDPF